MTIIADNVDRQLLDFIKSKTRKNINVSEHNLGSNGASFRYQLDMAASFQMKKSYYCKKMIIYTNLHGGPTKKKQPTMNY